MGFVDDDGSLKGAVPRLMCLSDPVGKGAISGYCTWAAAELALLA